MGQYTYEYMEPRLSVRSLKGHHTLLLLYCDHVQYTCKYVQCISLSFNQPMMYSRVEIPPWSKLVNSADHGLGGLSLNRVRV